MRADGALYAGYRENIKTQSYINLEDNRYPERRGGNSQGGKAHKNAVQRTVMVNSRQNAGGQAHDQRYNIGCGSHDDRVMECLQDQGNDRFLLEITGSHVSVQKIFQPVKVLDRKRGVKSHLGLYLGDLVRIRELTQHCRYRVSRDHVQDKECDQGDGKNDADSQGRPLYDISDQAISSFLFRKIDKQKKGSPFCRTPTRRSAFVFTGPCAPVNADSVYWFCAAVSTSTFQK